VKLHFVIPALNERGNLDKLGERLRAAVAAVGKPARVVLVDDGSTDGTGDAAPAAFAPLEVRVVTHPRNLGVAAAFRNGFTAAMEGTPDDDLVVTLEADNTSDVGELVKLVNLAAGGTDLVLASCYAPGGGVDGTTLFRVVLSGGANWLMRVWFGLWKLHTFSSFYRVYRVAPLRAVFAAADGDPLRERGVASVVELLVRFKAKGCSIAEVPVVLRSKERVGRSKMKVIPTMLGYFRIMGRLGPGACRIR
jgi:dolichol-phosphate mannosyltransferase